MLLFIRHATTVHQPDAPPETWALDYSDPEPLRRFRRRYAWDSVQHWFSSPELKAVATANELTATPVTLVARLRELSRAKWVDNYEEVVARVFSDDTVPAAPGWEPAALARERFDAALRQAVASRPGGDVAVVTHGLVLEVWSSWVAGLPPSMSDWRALRFPDALLMPDSSVRSWLSGDRTSLPKLARLSDEENGTAP